MPNTKPDKPLNRKEQYLNRISGDSTQELPADDLNREEQYLRAIVDHVGAIEEQTDGIGERITTLEADVTTATETAEAAKAAAEEAKEEASKTGINLLIGTNRGAENWLSANSDVQGIGYANTYGSLPYQTMKATSSKNEAPVLRFTINNELAKQTLKPNTKYTLSMDFSCAVGIVPSASVGAAIGLFNPEDNMARAWTDYVQTGTIMWTAAFQKIYLTLTTTEEFADMQQPYLWIIVKAAMTKGDAIEIRNLSLVEGEGGYRDWQPNPYEVPELAAQIDAVDVDVSGIHDSIQGIDESISSLETSVTDIQTETAGIGKITENGTNIISNLVSSWEMGNCHINAPVRTPYETMKIDSDIKIRSAGLYRTGHPFTVSIANPDYEFWVVFFDDAGLFAANLQHEWKGGKYYFDSDYPQIAVVIRRADDAPAITPENILDVGLKVQLGNIDLPIYTPPTVDINANAEAIAKLQAATPSVPTVNSGDTFLSFLYPSGNIYIKIGSWRQIVHSDTGEVSVRIRLDQFDCNNAEQSTLEGQAFNAPAQFAPPTSDLSVIMPGGIVMMIQPSGRVTFYCGWISNRGDPVSTRVDAKGTGDIAFTYLLGGDISEVHPGPFG